ncbi:uncharacterized protein KGF55_000869 [Candida pseudojiufengensis]|uniref:uncharacterized protein n=1 Tax=Candida pseudojiufengensis TaxID=497109 RepID=UPI002224F3DC|nr:uncharacterized protein KGF55_000869 [Candida pseudojiufengensis]KAI5966560.1 hypothetical protein KGF55_000869 [Candida pseudojiufengensis]
MTALLKNLTHEIELFNDSGTEQLNLLTQDSNDFLKELKSIESDLQQEIIKEELQSKSSESNTVINNSNKSKAKISLLPQKSENWYKSSIGRLKSYNSANNKFSKNILNNSKYSIDLDEAYTYPLNMDNYPVKDFNLDKTLNEATLAYLTKTVISKEIKDKNIKQENKEELMKAIVLHLLKIGQSSIVPSILEQIPSNLYLNEDLLERFKLLNQIVDDICIRHDLSQALGWLHTKYNEKVLKNTHEFEESDTFNVVEFKFHILQFIILLNGKTSGFSYDDAVKAYFYSKDHFTKFLKNYLHEIAPLMTLILFEPDFNSGIENFSKQKSKELAIHHFIEKIKQGFVLENDEKNPDIGRQSQIEFVSDLLSSFKNVHSNENLFSNISNDFIAEYCKDLNLSKDSSLFQSILAGHLYLPSFYKYNQIQLKMNNFKTENNDKKPNENYIFNNVATYHYELPFQLPDSNRFLFKNHPIFICPISREQLIPITSDIIETIVVEDGNNGSVVGKKKKFVVENLLKTQVVVLNYCQHLALRDSIWHLSKKGMDVFKCPYCYKKHKYNDVTDAFFIDL